MLRWVLIALLTAGPLVVQAMGHRSSGTGHATHAGSRGKAPAHHASPSPASVKRSATGKIARDARQRSAFRRGHPCPSTGRTSGACPGYEVDHVRPLACGGADAPSNMQWLPKAANRAKGSEGCRR